MTERVPRTPKYGLHKATGQAVVRIDGRDHYLGKYGSPEIQQKYDQLIAEWLANGRCLPCSSPAASDGLSVNELILTHWKWAEEYYRDEQGKPGQELDNIRTALKPLGRLYGASPAAAFGPLALRAIQKDLTKCGLSRGVVNARINRLRRVFKWAVSFQLIPANVYHSLQTVPGLQRGRCEAREAPPVPPVADGVVQATLPFLPAPVRAMVELQLLTGCRPGEVMRMRAIDLTMSDPVWTYRPASHKNKHRGLDRVIFLGPQAQEVIKPFLTTNLEAFLFSPRMAMEQKRAQQRAKRKTKVQPSQQNRRKRNPKRVPKEHYRRRSFRLAIHRGSRKARGKRAVELYREGLLTIRQAYKRALQELPSWSPLQLRHTAATQLQAKYGIEAARVILGHSKVETSQIYAERDLGRAKQIMQEIG
jgi:integrase